MHEYRVHRIDNDDSAKLEKVLNEEGQGGWRLVSTAADNTGRLTWVYLFLEREIAAQDGLEEAVATMDAGERRELMDIAVAQADGESRREPVPGVLPERNPETQPS